MGVRTLLGCALHTLFLLPSSQVAFETLFPSAKLPEYQEGYVATERGQSWYGLSMVCITPEAEATPHPHPRGNYFPCSLVQIRGVSRRLIIMGSLQDSSIFGDLALLKCDTVTSCGVW